MSQQPIAYYLGDINNGGVSLEERRRLAREHNHDDIDDWLLKDTCGLWFSIDHWMWTARHGYNTFERYAEHILGVEPGTSDVIDMTRGGGSLRLPDTTLLGLSL